MVVLLCGESRREAGASTTGFPSWRLGTSGNDVHGFRAGKQRQPVVYCCGQEVWARGALDAVAASWHGCSPSTGFPSWSLGTSGTTSGT